MIQADTLSTFKKRAKRIFPFWIIPVFFLTMGMACSSHSSGTSNSNTTMQKPSIELTGIDFTISYLADPTISYGKYEVTYEGDSVMPAHITKAVLEVNGEMRKPNPYFVYVTGADKSVDPDELILAPNATTELTVSFQQMDYYEQTDGTPTLHIEMEANGETYKASSKIRYERRIPRR